MDCTSRTWRRRKASTWQGRRSVRFLVGAEALSKAKREKLERMWGAEVNDLFGMTEIGILGSDASAHEGFHVWTDQAIFEVVDEKTGLPVEDGQSLGLMVITPLWLNNATPFCAGARRYRLDPSSASAAAGRFPCSR